MERLYFKVCILSRGIVSTKHFQSSFLFVSFETLLENEFLTFTMKHYNLKHIKVLYDILFFKCFHLFNLKRRMTFSHYLPTCQVMIYSLHLSLLSYLEQPLKTSAFLNSSQHNLCLVLATCYQQSSTAAENI